MFREVVCTIEKCLNWSENFTFENFQVIKFSVEWPLIMGFRSTIENYKVLLLLLKFEIWMDNKKCSEPPETIEILNGTVLSVYLSILG